MITWIRYQLAKYRHWRADLADAAQFHNEQAVKLNAKVNANKPKRYPLMPTGPK